MKNTLTAALFLFVHLARAQQSTLPGLVAVFNSQFETGKKAYVANAQVEEDYGRSQATVTGPDGFFRLPLVGIKDQEKVFYSVKKAGYEVVNADALQAVAGQAEPQRVFLAPVGQLAENKLKYYKINRQAAEKALTDKLQRLEKEILAAQSDQMRLKPLQEEYGRLQAQFEKIEETSRDLADRYARTNLDDVSADYQQAFRCFQRGQLDSALLIFQAADLEAGAAAIISEQGRNADLAAEYARRDTEKNKRKRETNDALQFKAQLHQTRFEFDRAEETYRLLLKLDSLDVYNIGDFANFLSIQNQQEKSIYYFEKGCKLAKTEDLIASFNDNMAISLAALNRTQEAEEKFKLSFEIRERLAKANPAQFEPDLARSANNLGVFYDDNNRSVEAEEKLVQAFEIREQLVKTDPVQFEPDLALTANNLGAFYKSNNRFSEAEEKFKLSFEIRERLAKTNPTQFEPGLAMTAANLGVLYDLTNRPGQAENKQLLAFEIFERLAQANPARFEQDLATAADNLGVFYSDNNRLAAAEKKYLLASNIRRRLVFANPLQFEPEFARTAHNLGRFYSDSNKPVEAEVNYVQAYQIRERLAKSNPEQFAPDWVSTAVSMGDFYSENQRLADAEKKYLLAFDILDTLAQGNDLRFRPMLAALANRLGIFYSQNDGTAEAEKFFLFAFHLQEELTKENAAFEPDLATAADNLGNFYTRNRRPVDAEEKFLLAFEIRDRLAKANPGQFESDLAATLSTFGHLKQITGQFDSAKIMYNKAIHLRQEAVEQGQVYDWSDFNPVYLNMAALRDSFALKADWITTFDLQLERIKCLELLQNLDPSLVALASTEYGALSWYSLLATHFSVGESASRRALELDSTQIWVNTNLAHALLFQGKYLEAEKIYRKLKDQPYDQEPTKRFRDIFLQDLDTLESAGIIHPDIPKIRLLLQQK